MTSTGKAARKRGGNRYACRRLAGKRRGRRKRFGNLPISVSAGNAAAFVAGNSGMTVKEGVK